jgi:hypothetical protein
VFEEGVEMVIEKKRTDTISTQLEFIALMIQKSVNILLGILNALNNGFHVKVGGL